MQQCICVAGDSVFIHIVRITGRTNHTLQNLDSESVTTKRACHLLGKIAPQRNRILLPEGARLFDHFANSLRNLCNSLRRAGVVRG